MQCRNATVTTYVVYRPNNSRGVATDSPMNVDRWRFNVEAYKPVANKMIS